MRQTHYTVLGVAHDADFNTLKRAYYRQAKRCHPDTDPANPALEEAFKRLVDAFDTLTDPHRRARYDESIQVVQVEEIENTDDRIEESIMDTFADDLLEELVVGNPIPRDTHLSTFFRDLQSTDIFMVFREAKNLCWRREFHAAWPLLERAVTHSPANIIYHYYTAHTAIRIGRFREAKRHFRIAIDIGRRRDPELPLARIRREFDHFQRTRGNWFTRLLRHLRPLPPAPALPPDEAMRRELQRAIANSFRSKRKKRAADNLLNE